MQGTAGIDPYCIYYLRTPGKMVTSTLRGNSLRAIGIAHIGDITSRLGDKNEIGIEILPVLYIVLFTHWFFFLLRTIGCESANGMESV